MNKAWLRPFAVGVACGGIVCGAAVGFSSVRDLAPQTCRRALPPTADRTLDEGQPPAPVVDTGNGWLTGQDIGRPRS